VCACVRAARLARRAGRRARAAAAPRRARLRPAAPSCGSATSTDGTCPGFARKPPPTTPDVGSCMVGGGRCRVGVRGAVCARAAARYTRREPRRPPPTTPDVGSCMVGGGRCRVGVRDAWRGELGVALATGCAPAAPGCGSAAHPDGARKARLREPVNHHPPPPMWGHVWSVGVGAGRRGAPRGAIRRRGASERGAVSECAPTNIVNGIVTRYSAAARAQYASPVNHTHHTRVWSVYGGWF
jgi:hypothetical protein